MTKQPSPDDYNANQHSLVLIARGNKNIWYLGLK